MKDHQTAIKTGIKINDRQIAELNILRDDFHGDWNYIINTTNHGRAQ